MKTALLFLSVILYSTSVISQDNNDWMEYTHPGTNITLEFPHSWWDPYDSASADTVFQLEKTQKIESAWGESEKLRKAGFSIRRFTIDKRTRLDAFVEKQLKELKASPSPADSETDQGPFVMDDLDFEIDRERPVTLHQGAEGETYKGYLFHGFYRPVRIYLVREGYGYEITVFADDSLPKEEFLSIFERMMKSIKMPWK